MRGGMGVYQPWNLQANIVVVPDSLVVTGKLIAHPLFPENTAK